jgi:hypothetical protein
MPLNNQVICNLSGHMSRYQNTLLIILGSSDQVLRYAQDERQGVDSQETMEIVKNLLRPDMAVNQASFHIIGKLRYSQRYLSVRTIQTPLKF